ncbi:LysM peptidoglycan-binding domain-containing protein [Candidatus Parcubacteria bacterium]|nr:MAG: LysM peptidoglycan-binding domain-containing protein [Candidatus Parcubacteria bacterium]
MSPKLKKNKVIDIPQLKGTESYKSLIYGTVTVAVLFVIVVFGLKIISSKQQGEITKQGAETTADEVVGSQSQGKKYIVAEGDTLWSIAVDKYGNGFKWNEIAKANKLENPSNIEKGTALNIPEVKEKKELAKAEEVEKEQQKEVEEVSAPSVKDKITGNTYTVKSGDDLWDIAIRAYGDGYKWTEIAQANKLENPNIIHNGNVLTLPR